MSNITSNTTDGRQQSGIISHATGWDAAHDNVGFSSPTTSEQSTTFFGPRAQSSSFRGGIYFLTRCFFDFNLQSISGTITAASFHVMTNVRGEGIDNIVLKSGHDPSTSSDDWFSTWLTGLGGTLSGWSNSDSEVVAYSSNTAFAASGVFTEFVLNSDALTQLNSLAGTTNPFKIVLMNYDFDYLDVDPQPSSSSQICGVFFADSTNSARRPFLELTISTGYGNKVIRVEAGSIGKVSNVATANIGKVIGVD